MSDVTSDDLPTLLILGEGEPLRPAIEEALTRHATFAEGADQDSAVAAVLAAAPDVIVLMGDAALSAEEVLTALGGHPVTRQVPVVVLLEAGDVAARLRAARSGVAVVERTASADAMAREIARLARVLPDQETGASGDFGEATLGDVLDIVRRELESGILSVHKQTGQGARFVLRQGRHVDLAIRDFVSRIRPLVEEAQPLHFDYSEAGAGFELLDATTEEGDRGVFRGRRVALIEDNAAVADALAQELRAHGAEVVVLSSSGTGLSRARHLDPEVVLIEERGLDGPAYDILRQVRSDPRLRWASLLVIRGEELMPEGRAPRMDRLAGAFAPLLAPDDEIERKAREEESFDTRLEALGPSRLLRGLLAAEKTFLMTVRHPRVTVEVSVTQGLVAGADATRAGVEGKVGGPAALAALLAIGGGRVTIERRSAPASANVFMPLGAALEAATQESPPIRPSILPGGFPSRPSTPPDKLLAELESVLGKLKKSGIISEELALTPEASRLSAPPAPSPKPPPKRPSRVPPPPPRVPRPLRPPPPVRAAKTTAGSVARTVPSEPPPRRKAKSKTLMGFAAPAPASLDADIAASRSLDSSGLDAHRATTPPRGSLRPGETRRTTEGSVSVAKFVLPTPEAGLERPLIERDQRADRRKTPVQVVAIDMDEVAVGVHAMSAVPASPTDFGPVNADVAPKAPAAQSPAAQPPVANNELGPQEPDLFGESSASESLRFDEHTPALPSLVAEPALAEAAPVLPRGSRTPLIVASVVVMLLLVAGIGWALSSSDSAVTEPLSDGTVETNAETSGSPPSTTPPQPTLVETPEVDPTPDDTTVDDTTVDDTTADDTTADDSTADDSTADDNIADDSTADDSADDSANDSEDDSADDSANDSEDDSADDGPGEGASRSEIIAWNLQSGNFHRNRRHYAVAERRYRTVLRLAPRNGRALAGLTRMALDQNKNAEAVGFARRLVRVNQSNAGNHVLLGDALRASGDVAGARAEWEAALRINRRHSGALRRLNR